MQHIKSIVAAVDFSPCSAAALAAALRIGAWNRAAVRAVHVIDVVVGLEPEPAMAAMHLAIRDGIVDDAAKAWAAFRETIPGASGMPCEILVDARVRGILAQTRIAHANILVIGAVGESAGDAKVETGFGSVAGGCVRHAECDVLAVRGSQTGPFRSVVAAVDFSDSARHALDTAVRVATQDAAALRVVHVYDAPWRRLPKDSKSPAADPAFKESYQKAIAARLAAFCKPLEHELRACKAEMIAVDAATHRRGIPDLARSVAADLVVIGTHGHSALHDMLLGTTAEKILRDSPCSVWVVRNAG